MHRAQCLQAGSSGREQRSIVIIHTLLEPGAPSHTMSKRSIFKTLTDSLKDAMSRKEVVGKDKLGNTYFRWYDTLEGQRVERREVKWAAPYMMYDPKDMPSEWRMWLRKLRDQPPTEQELAESASKAAAFRQRVAELEVLEQQRRVRQAAQGAQAAQPGSRAPDMSRLIQQMQQQDGAGSVRQSSGSSDTFKPETWKPGQ